MIKVISVISVIRVFRVSRTIRDSIVIRVIVDKGD